MIVKLVKSNTMIGTRITVVWNVAATVAAADADADAAEDENMQAMVGAPMLQRCGKCLVLYLAAGVRFPDVVFLYNTGDQPMCRLLYPCGSPCTCCDITTNS